VRPAQNSALLERPDIVDQIVDTLLNDYGALTVTVSNSILYSNSGENCVVNGATIDNGGYNISDDATCGFGSSTGANGKTIGDNVNPLYKAS